MLSKKECKRALENMHSQVDIETQWYSYDILKKLIDEHFGVKSEKELQNIYLNNNLDEVIEIQKNNLTDSYMIGLYNGLVTAKAILLNNNDNIKFEENRFFPVQCANLES